MASILKSMGWTGRDSEPQSVNTSTPYVPPAEVAILERPAPVAEVKAPYVPTKYEPVGIELKAYTPEQLAEYSEVAEVVGVSPADLQVEEFKSFLISNDFTVFDLATVVKFMDEKSKAEGRGWGWDWKPLRAKDIGKFAFGSPAFRDDNWGLMGVGSFQQAFANPSQAAMQNALNAQSRAPQHRPASDHYNGQTVYSQVVPLHALKKVALIEKAFKHPVHFVVSDYAPAPAFKADPFLMAIIPNANLSGGVGRYVIDVWDEPGFGIEHILKSGL